MCERLYKSVVVCASGAVCLTVMSRVVRSGGSVGVWPVCVGGIGVSYYDVMSVGKYVLY